MAILHARSEHGGLLWRRKCKNLPKSNPNICHAAQFFLSVVTQVWRSSAAHYNSPEASANDRWQRGTPLYLVVFACHCAYRSAVTFASLCLVSWLCAFHRWSRAWHRNVSALISAWFSSGVGGIEMRPRRVQRELKLRDKHRWTVGEKQMSHLVIMKTDRQAVKSLRWTINALCQKWATCVPRGCFQKNDSRFQLLSALQETKTSGLIDSSKREMRKKTAEFVFFCRGPKPQPLAFLTYLA